MQLYSNRNPPVMDLQSGAGIVCDQEQVTIMFNVHPNSVSLHLCMSFCKSRFFSLRDPTATGALRGFGFILTHIK